MEDPRGTQGRLLQWHPGACESKRKALPAYCPDLLARFCKESSLSKQEMLPDVGKRFLPYTSPHFLAKKHNALRSHGHRCEAGEFGRTRRANHVAGVCLLLFAPVGGWFRRGPCGIRVFETGSSSAWFRRMRSQYIRHRRSQSRTSSSAASRGSPTGDTGEDRSPVIPPLRNKTIPGLRHGSSLCIGVESHRRVFSP